MDLEMVFNELSARILAPDISTARQWMSELISTMREAKRCGLKGIRTQADFHAMFIAENYPLRDFIGTCGGGRIGDGFGNGV
ncbi:hypothetical protein QUA56_26765 [Microcoleus sp. N3A4]|uniref:hypothetical protein n=1 Tax=Microcoleus sp. N3A4 TaxID=3055379 RepID=UPI002FD76746